MPVKNQQEFLDGLSKLSTETGVVIVCMGGVLLDELRIGVGKCTYTVDETDELEWKVAHLPGEKK